ncbi:hypothetical protein HK096_001740 [Nowakowskiella sp. JEL0078]|nr:hypothetical protein HK096_001740 [Nowakowskiella sp. JEL0078]
MLDQILRTTAEIRKEATEEHNSQNDKERGFKGLADWKTVLGSAEICGIPDAVYKNAERRISKYLEPAFAESLLQSENQTDKGKELQQSESNLPLSEQKIMIPQYLLNSKNFVRMNMTNQQFEIPIPKQQPQSTLDLFSRKVYLYEDFFVGDNMCISDEHSIQRAE